MAHVIPSLRTAHSLQVATPGGRRALASLKPQTPFTLSPESPAQTPAQNAAPAPATQAPASQPTATPAAPDWRALFSHPAPANAAPAAPPPPEQKPAPTAESVFGANPWLTNPTGTAPNGQTYAYNPYYFATQQTAAKVAQMVGGTVVASNVFTPNGGGGFSQSQPNYMVQLQDGRLINPGLVASFYTHGYPQSYVDTMIAAEIRST